jgi:hypothetical protein
VIEIEFMIKVLGIRFFCIYCAEQEKYFLVFAFPFEANAKAVPGGLQFEYRDIKSSEELV